MCQLPSHAYLPGRNARHPEEAFDGIKETVREGMTAEEMARTEAWRTGWRYYREGFHWECHEVLEAVWMALPPNSAERGAVQALIQLANARLKLAMGWSKAARRLCALAEEAMPAAPDGAMGITPDWVAIETAGIRRDADRQTSK